MVPPASHRIPRVLWYSGAGQVLLLFRYGTFTPSGAPFQKSSPKLQVPLCRSATPSHRSGAVWAPPRSLAATYGIDLSFFSSRYLDVSVPGLAFRTLWIRVWMYGVLPYGLPHSDVRGSRDMCSSPRLFAAYHVFHRPKVPRHPPRVLLRLTF